MVKWEHYNGKQAENIQWNGKIMQVLEMEYLHFNYKQFKDNVKYNLVGFVVWLIIYSRNATQ